MFSKKNLEELIKDGFGDNIKTTDAKKRNLLLKTVQKRKESRSPFVFRFSKNESGRDFLVGDIHGNKEAFLKALESVSFDKTKDRLFSVGDLIDRGEDSLFILEQLKEKWFYAIRGNHEQMLIDRFELPPISPAWVKIKTASDAEKSHNANGGKWFDRLSSDAERQNIYKTLSALPYVIMIETEDGDVGLVHAEVPERYDNWNVFIDELEESSSVREDALWNRYAIMDVYDPCSYEYFDVTEPPRFIDGVFATIHGHTPSQEPIIWGNQLWIDTAYLSGELTIIEVSNIINKIKT